MKKKGRDRLLRWALTIIGLGGATGGLIYARGIVDDLEENLEVAGAAIETLNSRAGADSLSIAGLELAIDSLEAIPPVIDSIPYPVLGPIRWRLRVDSFPVVDTLRLVRVDSVPVPGPLRIDTTIVYRDRPVFVASPYKPHPLELTIGYVAGVITGLILFNGEEDEESDMCWRDPDWCD